MKCLQTSQTWGRKYGSFDETSWRAVAGAGLTGGADNILVGADGDTTFTVGAGNGISLMQMMLL